jgi:hypothetical protein
MDDTTVLTIRTPPPDIKDEDLDDPRPQLSMTRSALFNFICSLFVAGILCFTIGVLTISSTYFIVGVGCLFLTAVLSSFHGPLPTKRRPRLPSLYDTP